ncbi:OmpA family protein [Leptospira sp. 96542]|nr:OmpA family protein [Leptospira sp. 96542]
MAKSYYRTMNGKQYDNELLEIVEKATKRSKAPIGKNIAKTLFEAIKDGNDYTDIEKRTVKYIRDNFKFQSDADEYLRTEIRKWAAKISVPQTKKKPSPKKTNKLKKETVSYRSEDEPSDTSSYMEIYEEDSQYDSISPTPEYNELIALNKRNDAKVSNKTWRIVLLVLLGLFFVLMIILGIRSCNRSEDKSVLRDQTAVTSTSETQSRSLERVEINEGTITNRFDTRSKAIRYINELQIRFIKQTLETEPEAPNKISNLAEALKTYPEIKIRVMGHTDFIGELDENKILSDERAKFIKDELIKAGVNEKQIEYRGFGETTSVDTNYSEAGRVRNRRVDFTVLSVR